MTEFDEKEKALRDAIKKASTVSPDSSRIDFNFTSFARNIKGYYKDVNELCKLYTDMTVYLTTSLGLTPSKIDSIVSHVMIDGHQYFITHVSSIETSGRPIICTKSGAPNQNASDFIPSDNPQFVDDTDLYDDIEGSDSSMTKTTSTRFTDTAIKDRLMSKYHIPDSTGSISPVDYIWVDTETDKVTGDFNSYLNNFLSRFPFNADSVSVAVRDFNKMFKDTAESYGVADYSLGYKTYTIRFDGMSPIMCKVLYHRNPVEEVKVAVSEILGQQKADDKPKGPITKKQDTNTVEQKSESILDSMNTGSILDSLSVNILADLNIGGSNK